MDEKTPRPVGADEIRLLELLFSVDFPGRQELREQASKAKVRTIDENGSLEFIVADSTPANVKGSVPVSARLPDAKGQDAFGICVNLLLHVRGGVLRELEIYKDDGSLVEVPFDLDKAYVHAI